MTLPYFSVIIVGAGPTGLAAGNLLGMLGIDTLILERNAALSDCAKAISIDDEGLRICQAMGLHHPMMEHALLDIEALYYSGKRLLARVAPKARPNGFPLISTFHQPTLEAILFNGLKRFDCVSIQFQREVGSFEQHDEAVVVNFHTPGEASMRIECAYLLACDGGKSGIRRALGIPMRGSTYAQKWLVIDSEQDQEGSPVIKFFCNPARPAVTVPAPQQRRRWEFMLLPSEGEQDLLLEDLLKEERAGELIRQVEGTFDPHAAQITRRAIYTFHATSAAAYSQGRVFLLGDAAHMMPPFGGQGLNCGLRDAHNLCWKLRLALKGLPGQHGLRGLATSRLLESYSLERRQHTKQILRFSTFLGNIVMPTSKPLALLRDGILRTVNTIPAIHTYLSEGGIKPRSRYTRGCVIFEARTRFGPSLAGKMLSQPEITTSGRKLLLDDALGPGFALLRLHDDPGAAFAPLKSRLWQGSGGLDARFVTIQKPVDDFPLRNPDLFVLVRPDRYVLGVFKEHQEDAFVRRLQQCL